MVTIYNASYGNILVKNNEITNLVTGIYLNPLTAGMVAVTYNDIHDNFAGIGGFNNATVTYNEFYNNSDEAIGADDSFNGIGSISFNNFLTGDEVVTYAPWPDPGSITNMISAENNYWNLGGVIQALGSVDYDPEALVPFPSLN